MKHLIKVALFLLAATAAYYVYAFTTLVAPGIIALAAAGSLVGTYVGLAFADIPPHQHARAQYVALGSMAIEAAYGFLYVLSVQSPDVFHTPMSLWLSVPLALLHGSAVSILAFFVSLFVVHERNEAPSLSPRDAALIEMLRTMMPQPTLATVSPSLLTVASDDASEVIRSKSETIRQLARLQADSGRDVDCTLIATLTGYDLSYVQQTVSRWRKQDVPVQA